MGTQVSRRSVAKGAAWALPAITVAAAAPSLAASARPVLNANNSVTWNVLPDNSQTDDYKFRVYSAPDGNVDPPNSVSSCGPEVTGANTSTTVTNVSMTFWLPADNLTFENSADGAVTSGWTLLTRDAGADGDVQDTSGQTLYAYSSRYTGPITAVNGTICLGTQNWVSTSGDPGIQPATYNANLVATVDGQTQSDPGVDVKISDS